VLSFCGSVTILSLYSAQLAFVGGVVGGTGVLQVALT